MKGIFKLWTAEKKPGVVLSPNVRTAEEINVDEKPVTQGDLIKVAELFIAHQERKEATLKRTHRLKWLFAILASASIWFVFFGGISTSAPQQIEVAQQAFLTLPLSGTKETAHVALIPVDGDIDGDDFGRPGRDNTTLYIRTALELASEQKHLSAVIFYINSYGGDAAASAQGHRLIKKFREVSKIPVIAFTSKQAYSGGYYLGLGASEFVMDPVAQVGSVGVIMSWFSTAPIGKVFGIGNIDIATGPLKSCIGQWQELSPGCHASLARTVELSFRDFLTAMSDARGIDFETLLVESKKPNGRTNGGIFGAQDALAHKMVDRVETIEELLLRVAKNIAKKNPEYKSVEFVRYDKKIGLIEDLTGSTKKTMDSASRLMDAISDTVNNRTRMRAE